MKRAVIPVLILTILSAVASPFIGITVNADADNMTITEKTVYGDRMHAIGATVNVDYEHRNRLIWQTTYSISAENVLQCEYDYKFFPMSQTAEVNFGGVTISSDLHHTGDTTTEKEMLSGLTLAYREVYERTPVGKERTEKILISDYYDFYPISVKVHIPGFSYRTFENYRYKNQSASVAKTQILEAFNEYFKIPVSPEAYVEITVDRDPSDGHSTTGLNGAYSMFCQSAITDKVCYFAINNYSSFDNPIDTSMIKGGYGLYAIDYGKEYEHGIDLNSIRTVYNIPETEEITHIIPRPDDDKIVLFTADRQNSYMHVINSKGELHQKLTLPFGPSFNLINEEDFFVIIANEQLAVIAQEDGEYKCMFTADTAYR